MLKWLFLVKNLNFWTFIQNRSVRILSWARRKYQKLWTFWSWRFWNAFQGPMTMPLSATSCLPWSKIFIITRVSVISDQNFELWFLIFFVRFGIYNFKMRSRSFSMKTLNSNRAKLWPGIHAPPCSCTEILWFCLVRSIF